MYDFVELRSATDAFWQAIYSTLARLGLKHVPPVLTRPQDLPLFWSDPLLLLGQTCGYPLITGLCGEARYVATPRYKSRFSSGAEHKSVIISRRGSGIRKLADAYGRICAINMPDSNSGMNLLRLEIAKLQTRTPFFSWIYETRSHRNSMRAVADGKADIASIDCISFALIERFDYTLTRNLDIIAETETTAALPFITSAETDDETLYLLRNALSAVVTDPRNKVLLENLLIEGVEVLPAPAYQRVRAIEVQSIALGYPVLA